MTFKINNEAQIDLENIWLYTFETWSKEQADRYFNLIFEEIKYLTIQLLEKITITSEKDIIVLKLNRILSFIASI